MFKDLPQKALSYAAFIFKQGEKRYTETNILKSKGYIQENYNLVSFDGFFLSLTFSFIFSSVKN